MFIYRLCREFTSSYPGKVGFVIYIYILDPDSCPYSPTVLVLSKPSGFQNECLPTVSFVSPLWRRHCPKASNETCCRLILEDLTIQLCNMFQSNAQKNKCTVQQTSVWSW